MDGKMEDPPDAVELRKFADRVSGASDRAAVRIAMTLTSDNSVGRKSVAEQGQRGDRCDEDADRPLVRLEMDGKPWCGCCSEEASLVGAAIMSRKGSESCRRRGARCVGGSSAVGGRWPCKMVDSEDEMEGNWSTSELGGQECKGKRVAAVKRGDRAIVANVQIPGAAWDGSPFLEGIWRLCCFGTAGLVRMGNEQGVGAGHEAYLARHLTWAAADALNVVRARWKLRLRARARAQADRRAGKKKERESEQWTECKKSARVDKRCDPVGQVRSVRAVWESRGPQHKASAVRPSTTERLVSLRFASRTRRDCRVGWDHVTTRNVNRVAGALVR
nr:hypothetical protein CFP56_10129 [Quercus suber]